MSLSDGVALFLLGALVLYMLFGIADFGGGIWSGLSSGPRAREQRRLIDTAIAPIWEANHVWLILALVLLFVGFPKAFRVLSEGLHIPLELMLVGIVLRGSAFVFRQYGPSSERGLWGRIFSAASLTTPFFLGMAMGAITSGTLTEQSGTAYLGWLAPFPIFVGAMTTAAGAFLAAVYLSAEAKEPELRRDFTRRAAGAAVVLSLTAALCGWLLPDTAAAFRERFSQWKAIPALALLLLAGCLWLLRKNHPRWAAVLGAGAVALILLGWGVAQYPFLIAPDLTLKAAAAPDETLGALLGALIAGSVLVLPSLAWMLVTFKSRR
jgi:cytochrome bd ubiquinol oxidase subunit II